MNKKITPTNIVLSLAILGCAACSPADRNASTSIADSTAENHLQLTAQQLQHVAIEVENPSADTLRTVLKLQGTVDVPPQAIVSLSFPLGGYLKSTHLQPGMRVRKGQVLATLEDMQFIQLQQDYLTAKAKLALSESEYVRQRSLNASKASSDKVYEQAKAEFETNRIAVSALAQKLGVIGIKPDALTPETLSKSVNIYAPIDGYVSKVNVNIGKYTSPSDNLFELIDPRDIHLALTVFEGDLNKIAIGQSVVAFTNDNPGKRYPAHVIIGNRMLTEERMAEIHCHFDREYPELAPGMFMNAEVAIQTHQALTVPEEAVVRWEGKYYVFVERGDAEYDMIEVNAGVQDHGRQAIEGNGISKSTRVVTRNAYTLLMKMRNADEEG